jgi:chloramphenicol 3-O-phosphotransferase
VKSWALPALILDADVVLGAFPPERYGEMHDGALNEGLFRAAVGFLEAGISVVVEQVFWKPEYAADAKRLLAGHKHWFFLLTCSQAVAASREAARVDRASGTHLDQRKLGWQALSVDATIDTSDMDPSGVARSVLQYMDQHG